MGPMVPRGPEKGVSKAQRFFRNSELGSITFKWV